MPVLDMFGKPYPRRDAKCCVGKGWGGLIDEIYDLLESWEGESIVSQIKEKFGGLRFYVSTDYDILLKVEDICDRSYSVCEDCGEPGEPTPGSWTYTLCKNCWETLQKKREVTK